MHQFFRRGLLPFGIPSGPAILDPHVAAIGPTQPLERIEERRDAGLTLTVGLRVKRHQHADSPWLLRSPRERPAGCRTNNSFNEIASPHCLTQGRDYAD